MVTVKAKGYSQLEYILHLFCVSVVATMAGEPKLGPHPLWDQHQNPIAEHTFSTIGIFESDLIKIKISF